MIDKNVLTKKEAFIVLVCAIFLLLNIGAINSSGRRRAKEMVCLSNLLKWGFIFQTYTNNNDGYFYSGTPHSPGYWWIVDLEEHYQSYKQNRLWFCPEATKPIIDENGVTSPTYNVFNAWGIFISEMFSEDGISGSYGLNGYVLNVSDYKTFESGVPASAGWRTPDVADASNIPVFLDALRFDLWPLATDTPAFNENAAWSGNSMSRYCINRHNGAVNGLFMDWSARKVGLKELWTLKWHRDFDTEGPWTKAGGVQSLDWPEWMRNFKDY
jgi:prepilin-type processing-associated H-X9-DG protein